MDEDRNGIYEWIKTDAELNHGNSGGLSTDDQGRFVGVPTAGNTDDIWQDRAGTLRQLGAGLCQQLLPQSRRAMGAHVTNVQFAEVINRRGEPIDPATQFASGITDIYAVFDYGDFEDGGDFTYVWYSEGLEILRDALCLGWRRKWHQLGQHL